MGQELFEGLVRDWTYVVKKALNETAPLRSSGGENNNLQSDDASVLPTAPPICGPPQTSSTEIPVADLFRPPNTS
jgi:hypothetical protein